MSDRQTIGLFIDDGYLRFDPDSVDEPLRSWLENMDTEELMYGRVRVEVEARVSGWGGFDGPTLYIGDKNEPR